MAQDLPPIGTSAAPFTGLFNVSTGSKGYSISGLTINQPTGSNIGLFGYVSSAGVVSQIGITVVTSSDYNMSVLSSDITQGPLINPMH